MGVIRVCYETTYGLAVGLWGILLPDNLSKIKRCGCPNIPTSKYFVGQDPDAAQTQRTDFRKTAADTIFRSPVARQHR